jgi:hypothetical protein
MRVYHDGYRDYPDVMLFDLTDDPHEQRNLAEQRPDLVRLATSTLDSWTAEMMRRSAHGLDPMWTVMAEGGPYHTRGFLDGYLNRLRSTGRHDCADRLARKHSVA